MNELKVGDNVMVVRQIGKNGKKKEVKGEIVRFSEVVTIDNEPTAVVKFNKTESYWYPLSKIKKL